MKKNRIRICVLSAFAAILLLIGSSLKAQVTIGGDKKPEKFSALELISNEKTGLRMPMMTTAERNTLEETSEFKAEKDGLAKGLTIFNTENNCLEFWNGTKWISHCDSEAPPYISADEDGNLTLDICLPYMFTYQTMSIDAIYDVSMGNPAPSAYQWIVDDQIIDGATSKIYNYTPPAYLALNTDKLGNRFREVTIKCQIIVNGEMKESKPYKITIVKATKGVLSPIYVNAWKEDTDSNTGNLETDLIKVAFAHVNLGAESDTDPCGCLGDYYQWGRIADGHQKGDSEYVTTLADSEDLDVNGQVDPGSDKYGKSVYANFGKGETDWRTPSSNTLWSDGNNTYSQPKHPDNDPCPPGWKIPGQQQWASIYNGGAISGASVDATANTWLPVGNWVNNDESGYVVNSVLLLPGNGSRISDGPANTGFRGRYWSSTPVYSSNAYFMSLSYDSFIADINPKSNAASRAYGYGIRCIAE